MAHFRHSITKLQTALTSVAASHPSLLIDDIVIWHQLTLPWGGKAITSQPRQQVPPKHQDQPPRALQRAEDIFRLQDLNVVPTYLMPQPGLSAKVVQHPASCTKGCLQSVAIAWSLFFRSSAWHRKYTVEKGKLCESDRHDSDGYKVMWTWTRSTRWCVRFSL